MSTVSIAIVGDLDPHFEPHLATDAALRHSAHLLGIAVEPMWVPTPEAELAERLDSFDAFWSAPGSPYRSLDGALNAIRVARESSRPLLGTCAGFQHVVLEFARHVMGYRDAQSVEYAPEAPELFVTPLTCSVAGQVMPVQLREGSLLAAAYGASCVEERYYCANGLNPVYRELLSAAGLRTTATDPAGEARGLELAGHPFLVGTLFVPQVRSRPELPHPVVTAFLQAVLSAR